MDIKVSEIIDKIIEIAEIHNDEELLKWAYLESEGYYEFNKYITDNDKIPIYREIGVEHRDEYDRPLIIRDPNLAFVNNIRLWQSISELEDVVETKESLLVIKDAAITKAIKDNMNVSVCKTVFTPAGVKSIITSIRNEAFRRSKKHISKKELISSIVDGKIKRHSIPDKVSLAWLWKNVSWQWWFTFFGVVVGVFCLGTYVSGIPAIRSILYQLPGYEIERMVPQEVANRIESHLSKYIDTHNIIISELHHRLILEEQFSSDHGLSNEERNIHLNAITRIKEQIKEENANFKDNIKKLDQYLIK